MVFNGYVHGWRLIQLYRTIVDCVLDINYVLGYKY